MSRQSQSHDVVEATGRLKMRAGVGKDADAKTVNRGLDLARSAKIEEIWIELPLEPISLFKNHPV